MTQYCRYCSNMVCGDVNYCTVKDITMEDKELKYTNKCKQFDFNSIDALSENDKGYIPRQHTIPVTDDMNLKQIALGFNFKEEV